MQTTVVNVRSILTRTSGYLKSVCSHSLQPYRGCAFGRALCGVGCYVQHNAYLTQGRPWGSFLEARTNAAEVYHEQYERELRWARRNRGGFAVFLSSSTEPFLPQELRLGVTRRVLEAMIEEPPDELIVQTHSHLVTVYVDLYRALAERCELRFHVSIETDQESVPGLPPHASSVAKRLNAAAQLKAVGFRVVVTVSPLLPIAEPGRFFARIAEVADAVVIDHFIEGDGSVGGSRTNRTRLPAAMAAIRPESVTLAYREEMVRLARAVLPGRVGVGIDGFAGRYLER